MCWQNIKNRKREMVFIKKNKFYWITNSNEKNCPSCFIKFFIWLIFIFSIIYITFSSSHKTYFLNCNSKESTKSDRIIQLKRVFGISKIVVDSFKFPITSTTYFTKGTNAKCKKIGIIPIKVERKNFKKIIKKNKIKLIL